MKEEKNSNANVCPCVSCSVVVLFTCTLVRSRRTAMKGLGAKPDPLGQTARYWMKGGKKEIHLGRITGRGAESKL